MNKAIKITGWILLGITFFITLFIFFHTAILSLKDFTPLHGIFGSAWIGLKNYFEIFSSPYLARIFINTALISTIGALTGTIYVFLGICAATSFKKPALKALFTIIFTVPAIIPNNLYTILIGTEFLIKPSFLLQALAGTIDSLRLAALFIPVALFISEGSLSKALKCALMFLGIKLIFFLNIDTTYLYNPATYEVLDTFSNFVYRKGMMEGSFSYSSAMFIIKTAIQLVMAFIGFIIILCAEKIKANETSIKKMSALSPFALIPLGVLIFAIVFGSSGVKNMTSMLMPHYFIGILHAFLCALSVSVVALFAANAIFSAGAIGTIIITVLCAISINQIGSYFIIRQFGLINTHIGVLMENLKYVPLVALIFSCILKCADNNKSNILLFITGAGIMFARFWGDGSAATVILKDRNQYPISVIINQINMQAPNQMAQTEPFAAVLYILIPLIVVCVTLILGAILKNKKNI